MRRGPRSRSPGENFFDEMRRQSLMAEEAGRRIREEIGIPARVRLVEPRSPGGGARRRSGWSMSAEGSAVVATPAAGEGGGVNAPLEVAILWHMHQPDYRDRRKGRAVLPWVRLHAVKDYYTMAALVDEAPECG